MDIFDRYSSGHSTEKAVIHMIENRPVCVTKHVPVFGL